MPKFEQRSEIKVDYVLSLTEREMEALSIVFGCDMDVFLEVFYTRLGAVYLRPYEKELREFAEFFR